MAKFMVITIAAFVLAACGGPGGASPHTANPSFTIATPSPALTPAPDLPNATPPPVIEIPQSLLDPILEQASELSSLPVEQLTVERAEAVTWPDGSLGCPEPGMMYTQALVDGYWVVIRAGDTSYDFRGTGNNFRLCENPAGIPSKSIEIPPPIQEPPDRY